MAVKARLALTSLAALAWAQGAAAQPTIPTVPADGPGAPVLAPVGTPVVAPALPAAVPTDIRPDRGNPLDLGTEVTRTDRVTTIDGGTRAGTNLFHSFSRFDLAQGDFARWVHSAGDPLTVRNVVNRVTGGDPSHIFGTIDSTALPNADFFFINPAGIVFGDGAQVDVPAAAHFSTATELRFADGAVFTVATPNGSTFSVASPAAFGFVGGEGSIRLAGARPGFISGGTDLSLSAANVAITDSAFAARSLRVTAVGGAGGEAALTGQERVSAAGQVAILETGLVARGSGGMRIFGGQVAIDRSLLASMPAAGADAGIVIDSRDSLHLLQSDLRVDQNDPAAGGAAGPIILRSGGEIVLGAGTTVATSTAIAGDGASGDILIEAPLIRIGSAGESAARAVISSSTLGSADAGNVTILAGRLSLQNGVVQSTTQGPGNAGQIVVNANVLTLANLSRISTDAGEGCTDACGSIGNAGRIEIVAGDVTLDHSSAISSATMGAGAGGEISIEARHLSLTDNARISSNTEGAGDAGRVFISLGGDLLASGGSRIETSTASWSSGNAGLVLIEAAGRVTLSDLANVSSTVNGSGNGGAVSIAADEIFMSSGATVTTDIFADCDDCASRLGGDIILSARNIVIAGGSDDPSLTFVASDTFGPAPAGSVSVIARESLTVAGRAFISSDTYATGNAGAVFTRAPSLLLDGGEIRSAARSGMEGDAGLVVVKADDLVIRNSGRISTSTADGSGGDAGGVLVEAVRLTMEGGKIDSVTGENSTGAAGAVFLDVGALVMREESSITSDTSGSGDAGEVEIRARTIDVDTSTIGSRALCPAGGCADLGAAGTIEIVANRISLTSEKLDAPAALTTISEGGKPAGDISVRADLIEVGRNARITSATSGGGDAGTVSLRGGALSVFDGGAVASRADRASTGDAGAVDIEMTGPVSVVAGTITSASAGVGEAGTVRIKADALTVDLRGVVTSSAGIDARGAGTVMVEARQVLVDRGGAIFTDTAGAGPAGRVFINAAETLRLDRRATISSNTAGSGNAGGVLIRAGSTEMSGQAEIASRTEDGSTGDAGQVRIEGARLVVREGAGISSSTVSSGNAGRVVIDVRDVTVTDRGSITSSTLGSGDAGTIEILNAASLIVDQEALINSTSAGSGAAGDILITAGSMRLDNRSVIASAAGPRARRAGTVAVLAASLDMANGAAISTSTFGRGDAGRIGIFVDDLGMDSGARIASNTGGACEEACVQTGNAGEIAIVAEGKVSLAGGSEIGSNGVSGSGNAGQVVIAAGELSMAGGRISTSTSTESSGGSGVVAISTGNLTLEGTSSIETISRNDKPAGVVVIEAADLVLRGARARIASSNESRRGGDAGAVFIEAGNISLFEGAQINTSSIAGAAGDISLDLPATAFLKLESSGAPSLITTSSGPGTGGRILISSPFAIISDGGSILALGNQGGANVAISTQYFIRSSDRLNRVAVDGDFLLEAAAYDVSAGTVNRDLSVLDASGVLRGQCAATRSTGQVSQLVVRPIGPYGTRPTSGRPDPTRLLTAAEIEGSCS
jgi:filamentous hemagglutinin family protein